MLSLLEIAERAMKGPRLTEKEWDLSLFRKMTELTRKWEIDLPKGDHSWFNTDEALPDRAFQAALDFLSEQGVYSVNTNRVIHFTRDEVLAALRETPRYILVGEGRDQRRISQKKFDGNELPNQWPGHHAPFDETMAPLVVKNFAQIQSGDYLQGFNFVNVDGREVYGLPMETYAARREIAWMRDGIRKAGRPGMAIALYPISTRGAAMLAPLGGDAGLRPTDGVLISVLPDVKMEMDMLAAAIVYEDYGCFKITGAAAQMGGFCGGMEGAIIESIVQPIAGLLVYRDRMNNTGFGSVMLKSRKTIDVDRLRGWGQSVVCQALNKHTPAILFGGTGGPSYSSPGTETRLWENAYSALRSPIHGTNLGTSRQAPPTMNSSQTPLEPEWMYEVAAAGVRTGLNSGNAGPFLEKIASRLEGLPIPPVRDTREVYDWVRHEPKPEYREHYLRVKDTLSSWGLQFA